MVGSSSSDPVPHSSLSRVLRDLLQEARRREAQQNKLDQLLQQQIPHEFHLQKVSGDGNCLHMERYCAAMETNGEYGDELCLNNLAKFYKVDIHVTTPEYGIQLFEFSNPDFRYPARLGYNGFNHYDVILFQQSPIASNRDYFSFRATETVTHNLSQVVPVEDRNKGTQSQDTFTILSANVTSWEKHSESLLCSGADALL